MRAVVIKQAKAPAVIEERQRPSPGRGIHQGIVDNLLRNMSYGFRYRRAKERPGDDSRVSRQSPRWIEAASDLVHVSKRGGGAKKASTKAAPPAGVPSLLGGVQR